MTNDWSDQAGKVRTGEELPVDKLQRFLLEQLPDAAGELEVEQFPSGFSNLTYLIRLGDRQLVLRRPPFGADIKSAHDMGREYRILSALSAIWPKAPKPYLYAEDPGVIGAPFYVMQRVNGVILRPRMPDGMNPDPETMQGIADGLIDTLAELHRVDYRTAGLSDLGRPEGYIERQVNGWTRRYLNARTDDIPPLEKAAGWLQGHLPGSSSVSLIHNDFKYDNVVLDPADWTRIIAVLDWEMATLGDPLMDLGTTLGYWVNANDPDWLKAVALSPTVLPGNPSRSEVVERYARMSGRNTDRLVFYYAYGLFKIAVIAQQIYYRYKKGFTRDQRFASLNRAVEGLGAMAMQAISKNRVDDLF